MRNIEYIYTHKFLFFVLSLSLSLIIIFYFCLLISAKTIFFYRSYNATGRDLFSSLFTFSISRKVNNISQMSTLLPKHMPTHWVLKTKHELNTTRTSDVITIFMLLTREKSIYVISQLIKFIIYVPCNISLLRAWPGGRCWQLCGKWYAAMYPSNLIILC